MKKILLWTLLSVFVFTGCQSVSPEDVGNITGSSGESEDPAPQIPPTYVADELFTPFQEIDQSLPDYACSGTYYKLEITPTAYDADAIMDYLLPEADKGRAKRDKQGYYSVKTGKVTHTWGSFTWDTGFDNFIYRRNAADLDRTLTEQEALGCSDAFVRHMGYQVAENPEFVEGEDGSRSVYYHFAYEGVPILGNFSYTMENNEPAYGEYIEVTMDKNGITRVFLRHLYDVGAVLEEYPAEKLMDRSRLEAVINRALEERFEFRPWGKWSFWVKEIELVYILAREEEKWVLIPVFRVRCVEADDGEEEEVDVIKLFDAVSGEMYK